jgi:hypothetical protein
MKELIEGKWFVYSIWPAKFECVECNLMEPKNRRVVLGTKTDGYIWDRRYECSDIPGVVYNGLIWLHERDDKLAKEILLEYVTYQYEVTRKKANNFELKIKKLTEEES